MDPRLARALTRSLATVAALAVVSLGASFGVAQQNAPTAPGDAVPAPAAPGDVAPAPASPPVIAPPSVAAPAPIPSPANEAATADAPPPPPANVPAPTPEKPPPPIVPPRPVRGAVAVLQVLDKVTAETLRFEVPVGGRVRYKSLLIEVKVCETRGVDDPQPKPSAYLDVTSDPRATVRAPLTDRKEVFKGWMFANAPGVHAMQHPTYDLWLITCGAAPTPLAAAH